MARPTIVASSSLILLALAPPAVAQNSQTPLVPGLERFELNGERTRATTTPAPRPSARPTPTARVTPAPRATPAPRVAEPTRRPEPADVIAATTPPAAPLIAPTTEASPPVVGAPDTATSSSALIDIGPDQPLVRATPTPIATDTPAVDASGGGGIAQWMVLVGILVILLAGGGVAGYIFWRRLRPSPDDNLEIEMDDLGGGPDAGRSDDLADLRPIAPRDHPSSAASASARGADLPDLPSADDFPPAPPQSAAPAPSPAPVFIRDSAPTPGPRAWLEIAVRPQRAGTNLTSAAVDYEIDIANKGDATATGIRLDLRLLSASADQDAILTTLYAAPIDKPVVAPFDISAGEQVSLGGMALLPREALSIMTVQDRDFFVPLLSLNLVYSWGGAARGQTASAHVIGIERPDDAKMAPFRLDTGPRMYDNVGARLHTLTVIH